MTEEIQNRQESMNEGTLATEEALEAMERNVNSFSLSDTAQDTVAESKNESPEESVAPAKDDSNISEAKDSSSQSAQGSDSKGESGAQSRPIDEHGGGIGDSERMNKQSLGAFHRLQPMGGSSLAKLRHNLSSDLNGSAAPWDADGRPRALGKGIGSPFGKSMDFKKGPGPGGL